MKYSDFAPELMTIARHAGAAIMEIYESDADFGVEAKSDDSPLTKADRAANTVICDALEKMPNPFPIVSEENKAIAYETRKDYPYYWLVDPLDGTKEFIKKNGEFTVNIALIHEQRAVLGVVYAPAIDEMYWAAKGEGAFLIQNNEKQRLTASYFGMKDEKLRVVCSRSHLNEGTQKFVDDLTNPELVAKGSSLKFLILASGNAELYPRLAPTMEWDTAAAQIVLEEAGGKVLQADTDTPLLYNKENLLNPHFIAYGGVERVRV